MLESPPRPATTNFLHVLLLPLLHHHLPRQPRRRRRREFEVAAPQPRERNSATAAAASDRPPPPPSGANGKEPRLHLRQTPLLWQSSTRKRGLLAKGGREKGGDGSLSSSLQIWRGGDGRKPSRKAPRIKQGRKNRGWGTDELLLRGCVAYS